MSEICFKVIQCQYGGGRAEKQVGGVEVNGLPGVGVVKAGSWIHGIHDTFCSCKCLKLLMIKRFVKLLWGTLKKCGSCTRSPVSHPRDSD